uniref:Sushi domain-containing protein n=1 Tax=Gopherus evgoodei TaxID=1825980 RepID=A0A8C4VNI2_9SAUR
NICVAITVFPVLLSILKFSFLPAVPQCPSPPAIANGKPSIQASAVFNSGTSVNYSCEPGYSLTGQASIYCTASGVWSPPPPRCEEVLCIAPEIQNGRKVAGHGPVYRHRDTVRFECDPGYTLIGSRQIHQCQTDDTWDPPLPVCELGKCQNSDLILMSVPHNMIFNYFLVHRSICRYFCFLCCISQLT